MGSLGDYKKICVHLSSQEGWDCLSNSKFLQTQLSGFDTGLYDLKSKFGFNYMVAAALGGMNIISTTKFSRMHACYKGFLTLKQCNLYCNG